MSSTFSQHPAHVLILGAGLGGLTLAQSLRNKGISFSIFERDESIGSRSQGWAIGVHSILEDIEESFPKDLPPIDTTSHLLPIDLPAQACYYHGDKKYFVESDESHKIIRANRQRLREWLATGIDVQWNMNVTRIEENEVSVTLFFSDGSSTTGDVLIGADGAHSVVRSHVVPNIKLNRVPVSPIIGEPVLSGMVFQHQLDLGRSASINGTPNFQTFIGVNSVASDMSSGNYYWFLIQPDFDGSKTRWMEKAPAQEQLEYVLKTTAVLDPKFTEIFRLTKPEQIKSPPLTFYEVEIEKLPRGRITLLGDAAHCMTPFRGEGGVQAMRDALNLARAINKSNSTNIPEALKDYESEMFPRGLKSLRQSRAAVKSSDDESERMIWGTKVQEAKAY